MRNVPALVVELGGERPELSYKGANHCPGNIFIYAPKQKVLTKIDIVSPGSCTFMHCDASENISGWIEAHAQILEYDFDSLVGGHIVRWGTRDDVLTSQEYFSDMQTYVDDALLEMFVRTISRSTSPRTRRSTIRSASRI